jgi:hypothetical protein
VYVEERARLCIQAKEMHREKCTATTHLHAHRPQSETDAQLRNPNRFSSDMLEVPKRMTNGSISITKGCGRQRKGQLEIHSTRSEYLAKTIFLRPGFCGVCCCFFLNPFFILCLANSSLLHGTGHAIPMHFSMMHMSKQTLAQPARPTKMTKETKNIHASHKYISVHKCDTCT